MRLPLNPSLLPTLDAANLEAVGKLAQLFDSPLSCNRAIELDTRTLYEAPGNAPLVGGARITPRSRLQVFFAEAADNYHFLNTTDTEWDAFVRFPNEKARIVDGRWILEEHEAGDNDVINASKENALSWVDDVFIPFVRHSRRTSTMFIKGEPGSGKTTLFKYLLNAKRQEFLRHGIVTCRFEAGKFFDGLADRMSAKAVAQRLDAYIRSIIFRDIVYTVAFGRTIDGRPSRSDPAGNPFRDIRACENFIMEIAPERNRLHPEYYNDDYIAINKAVSGARFVPGELKAVDPTLQLSIIQHFTKEKNLKICLIIDGMDVLSGVETTIDSSRALALRLLMNKFALHSQPESSHVGSLAFEYDVACATFILRKQTYIAEFVREKGEETRRFKFDQFEVDPIDPQVVLLNAVRRCVYISKEEHKAINEAEAETLEGLLLQAIGGTLAALSKQLGIPAALAPINSLLVADIFNRNIRELLRYVSIVFAWVMNRMLDAPTIAERSWISLITEATLLRDRKARRLIVAQSYRLIDFLLIGEQNSFHNALLVRGRSVATEDGRLWKRNNFYMGFVDNIFDYHCPDHVTNPDQHCLLEKIRVLQLLDKFSGMPEAELELAMTRTFGYNYERNFGRLKASVQALVHARLVEYVEDEAEYDTILSITRRGTIAVRHLLFNPQYMLHVLHRTRLPKALRDALHGMTTVAPERAAVLSIARAAIFLGYINYVESNPAGGQVVDSEYRIAGRIGRAWKSSVRKMCQKNLSRTKTQCYALEAPVPVDEILDAMTSRAAVRLVESICTQWGLEAPWN